MLWWLIFIVVVVVALCCPELIVAGLAAYALASLITGSW